MLFDIETILSKVRKVIEGNYVQEEIRAINTTLLKAIEANRRLLEEVEEELERTHIKEPNLLFTYECLKEEERVLKEFYNRWHKYLLFLVSQGLISQDSLKKELKECED
ncbi:MAG: hypothetical protein QXH96_00180 [Candidatus Geothermarchaeota archaeon]